MNLATRRRLIADLKLLHDQPIPLAAAAPCHESDITLWDGVIGVQMEVTDIGTVTVPLHFLIDFPFDFPQSAPNIGFSFEFDYHGGAEYVMSDGRLKGKKVICLDILGNFRGIHTEWKNTVGSGWSPAYTVSTLLIQLQSVLSDLGQNMTQTQRDLTYKSAIRFCEETSRFLPQIFDEDQLREQREQNRIACRLASLCKGEETLIARVRDFATRAGISAKLEQMDAFLGLVSDIVQASAVPSCRPTPLAVEVDANICCWSTRKLYTETLLGVGISRAGKNLTTAAEFVSKEAFDAGIRQNTDKSSFEFFLPVWINKAHAAQKKEWLETMKNSVFQIGKLYNAKNEDEAIIEVFARLINQMIVEMMRPDNSKTVAIALFEAMCNFWRSLRWFVEARPSLQQTIGTLLSNFVSDEKCRHKDAAPDLGVILVLFTVFHGQKGCPDRRLFTDSYLDENSLRWVMWWQKDGVPPESHAVFQATKVSRDICMFQMMVVDIVIGDPTEVLVQIEATNCKLPERLQELQNQWRLKQPTIDTWSKYFAQIQATQPPFSDLSSWIRSCVSRAQDKGPKYGQKGHQKGQQKGQQKGWGKGNGKSFGHGV